MQREPSKLSTAAMIDAPPLGPLAGAALPCYVFGSHEQLARHVAVMIGAIVRERAAQGQNAVLGLPTGSTPVGIYRELIHLHQEEGLDFSNVVTFNLDEYLGLGADRSAKLSPLDARTSVRPREHRAGEHPRSRRANSAGEVGRALPRVRCRHRSCRRHRHPVTGHRSQRPHRLQRALQHRTAAARASARSTR